MPIAGEQMKSRIWAALTVTAALALGNAAAEGLDQQSLGIEDIETRLLRDRLSNADRAPVHAGRLAMSLVKEVRRATAHLRDANTATKAGYTPFLSCAGRHDRRARRVHFMNDELVRDGRFEAGRPEVLIYVPALSGALQLIAVHYVVDAQVWNASQTAPPTFDGHAFHYTSSPNGYGIPAFYDLYVRLRNENAAEAFAGSKQRISCERYTTPGATLSGSHALG
jgi:hypothetical protein